MKKIFAIFVILLTPYLTWAETDNAESRAVETAQAWLALVDTGAYAQSWENASAYFRGAVNKARWEQTARGGAESPWVQLFHAH